jgi:hypothetical protein
LEQCQALIRRSNFKTVPSTHAINLIGRALDVLDAFAIESFGNIKTPARMRACYAAATEEKM